MYRNAESIALTLPRTAFAGPPKVGVRPVTVTSTTGVPVATTASSSYTRSVS